MRNLVTLTGRLTKDPVVFENADDSKTVMVDIAVQNSFTNKDGKRDSQFIKSQAFVKADAKSLGPYEHIKKGDLVGLNGELRSTQYVSKETGKIVYAQYVFINSVDMYASADHSKETTDNSKGTTEIVAETVEIVEDDVPQFD